MLVKEFWLYHFVSLDSLGYFRTHTTPPIITHSYGLTETARSPSAPPNAGQDILLSCLGNPPSRCKASDCDTELQPSFTGNSNAHSNIPLHSSIGSIIAGTCVQGQERALSSILSGIVISSSGTFTFMHLSWKRCYYQNLGLNMKSPNLM